MKFKTQRRISAQILKVGENKIWFDPSKLEEIKEAITKEDIRNLIKSKSIKKIPFKSQSKVRARKIALQKRKGRRKGQGRRKGKKTARLPRKKAWISKIRIQRKFIRELKVNNLIDSKVYRNLFLKAKGGFFRSKRHIKLYLSEHNIIKNE